MVDEMIEPIVGSENSDLGTTTHNIDKGVSNGKKKGHFLRNSLIGAGIASIAGFTASTLGNFDETNLVETTKLSAAQKLSVKFPNGRYLDNLKIIDSKGKSVFSGTIPGIVYSNKKTETNRILSYVPNGDVILSTKVNGKKAKFENSSFLPKHAGDNIELVVGVKPVVSAHKKPVPIVTINPKTHASIISTFVRTANLENKLSSTLSNGVQSQKTYDGDFISNGVKHKIKVDYTANTVSVDGYKLTHSYSDLESQILETVNGNFNTYSLGIGENGLEESKMLIKSGNFPTSLEQAVIISSLALLSEKSDIIFKYFTESAGDMSVRFAKDSNMKYINSNGKSDIQERNIQEDADVKKYVHNPSASLTGKRGKINYNGKTDLVKQIEFKNMSPFGEISNIFDLETTSKRGINAVRAISSPENELAFENVENQKTSLKDLGKMALGIGSYGSALFAVYKTAFNPLSQMNAGFKDTQRNAIGVANYTLNNGVGIGAAFERSKIIYAASFQNGMSNLGGNK